MFGAAEYSQPESTCLFLYFKLNSFFSLLDNFLISLLIFTFFNIVKNVIKYIHSNKLFQFKFNLH